MLFHLLNQSLYLLKAMEHRNEIQQLQGNKSRSKTPSQCELEVQSWEQAWKAYSSKRGNFLNGSLYTQRLPQLQKLFA